jgi:alpha-mannosidase
MIFVKERAEVICSQLKKLQKVSKYELSSWQMKKGDFLRPSDADASAEPWEAFDSRTMHWYGPDAHYWFRTEYTVPDSENGKPLWMILHTQIEEWDDAKNPQFLLFVDGEITQGMDMNHREVLLTKAAKAGQTYHFDIQSYTGTLHTEFQLLGEIAEISESVHRLYYDLQVPLWSLDRMKPEDKTRIDIQTVLNDTINLLDLRKPHSEEFYRSVDEAHAYISQKLYTEMGGCDDIIATCIGHTHIDVAWWWTVAQTREKVARSFATVLKLMDEYPDYKFISSQPQLYVFLKERYPELYAKVKERIQEGRWEAEGGMWLEADCNLTSGESLTRQFLYGKRFFKEEFGVDNRILWLPDVFGYSGALPQIMKKCGIDYFMTTKLSWNQFNKVPNDTLLWEGIDGSSVLTHFISTLGVGQSTDRFFTTYNGTLHPDAIMGGWERYQNKEMNNDILISYGYGDGGGGPTREMLETGERMEKGIKGVPKVRQAFAGQYFRELEERVKDSKRLATWTGEFYFEYHRGTYTSMARNKRANRKSELMLMDLELLSLLAEQKGIAYPQKELESMWKTVLLNQFHDILPGSSIHEVYEVTKREYDEIQKQGTELLAERFAALTQKGDGVTVYNTLGFERNDVVALGDCSADALQDETGTLYPVQKTAAGSFAYLRNLPSKGWKTFAPAGAAKIESPFKLSDNTVETPFYTITFDENGNISSLFDKENSREVAQKNKSLNQLRVFEDKPIYYDNWDIDIFYQEKYWDVNDKAYMRWTENGPVEAVLEIERPYSNSLIRQKIHFYADSRRIDFETYVDWHESQHLLKVLFPCDLHTDEATFDIQFGNVTRKTHTNTSWDMARFESCGHKWADVSEGGYGVAVLNDCKYGHSAHEGEIDLTLIKSGIEPNATTDQEEHFFTYSLYPHTGKWQQSDVPQEAYKLNQPTFAVAGGKAGDSFSLVSCNADNAVVETVKKAENGTGIVVRVYENRNMRTNAVLTFNKPVKAVSECDLLENPIEKIDQNGNTFAFTIRPYEIKTFLVQF